MTKKPPTFDLGDEPRGQRGSPESTTTAQDREKALKDYMLDLVLREALQGLPNQWINDAEFTLWDLVQLCDGSKDQSQRIHTGLAYHKWTTITEDDILKLKERSKAEGAWCFWEAPDTRVLPNRQLVCLPISEWEQMHERRLVRYIDQGAQRRRALKEIIQLGYDPYPHKFDRTHSITQIVSQFENQTGEELETNRPQV